jgi:hypothetical protein
VLSVPVELTPSQLQYSSKRLPTHFALTTLVTASMCLHSRPPPPTPPTPSPSPRSPSQPPPPVSPPPPLLSQRGQVIIKQGERGDHFYIAEKGVFDVMVATTPAGQQQLQQQLNPTGDTNAGSLNPDTPFSKRPLDDEQLELLELQQQQQPGGGHRRQGSDMDDVAAGFSVNRKATVGSMGSVLLDNDLMAGTAAVQGCAVHRLRYNWSKTIAVRTHNRTSCIRYCNIHVKRTQSYIDKCTGYNTPPCTDPPSPSSPPPPSPPPADIAANAADQAVFAAYAAEDAAAVALY